MSLRRRKLTTSAPSTSTSTPQEDERPLPPLSSSFNRKKQFTLILTLTLILTIIYIFLTPSSSLTRQRSLGSNYAICTKEENGIITLSPSSTNESDPSGEGGRTQCLIVSNGKIIDMGTIKRDGILEKYGGDVATKGSRGGIKVVRLKGGRTVLPGLIDAHAHVLQYGESKTAVDLVGSTSVKEVRERIRQYILNDSILLNDPTRFILGLGWDQTKFEDVETGMFPTAADLISNDPLLQNRPIYLKRIDVHALWVSPNILERLPKDLPDEVQGGKIVRDEEGKETGVFLDNAMKFVTSVIPPWTDESRLSFLQQTSLSMLQHGLTSVHDASLSLSDIKFLKQLDREKRLPVRIVGMLSCDEPKLNGFCGDEEEAGIYEGDRFTMKSVKLFVDGALGSWGAAMHEPYTDNVNTSGILICQAEELNEIVEKWTSRGYQVNSHGIGDLANTLILEAYSRVLQNSSNLASPLHPYNIKRQEQQLSLEGKVGDDWKRKNPLRLRIEHAQILREDDIRWMGEMGIVASFQPTHATSDMDYVEKRIGPERVRGAYAWRKIINSTAPYCLGSDFPVEQIDPFHGIYSSTTRKYLQSPLHPIGGSPHGENVGWYEEERLTPLESLKGFTKFAAEAGFQETMKVGQLGIGFEADFVVVEDGDVLELGMKKEGESLEGMRRREGRLGTVGERVRATVVEGRVVYGSLW